ncbi:MAG TPA: hypothetical protein VGM77_09705 [Gemmatimonadales bacterium]|jgi:hypothetical protein
MTDACSRCCARWWPDVVRGGALLAVASGLLLVARPAGAQLAVSLTGGAFASSALIKDGVLNTTLQPAIAPSVGVGIAFPLSGRSAYRLRLQTDVSRGAVNVTDNSSNETGTLTTVTMIDATLMIEGALRDEIRWEVGGGALFYLPSEDVGVFQSGSARCWLLAAGLTWHHPLSPGMSLLIAARVDSHEFSTDELRLRGYARSQAVERFGLHVGVERSF